MLNFNFKNIYGIKINRHPVVWVEQVLSPFANSFSKVGMSKYIYIPQSFTDYRQEFSLPIREINKNKLIYLLSSLNNKYELAMHSKIEINNKIYHFPMIDFSSKTHNPVTSKTVKELSQYWKINFNIYESGRSYHAYGDRLLTNDEWIQFMGSLLLLNKPSGYKLIDERWVGHRIMAGYASLRWSKNTSHYKRFPTLCGVVTSY